MSDDSRTTIARANIQAALALRGRSSFEVSTHLGKNRTYLDDFIKGRKESISLVVSEKLAELLNVNRYYIIGSEVFSPQQPVPAKGPLADALRYARTLERIKTELARLENQAASGGVVDLEEVEDLKESERRYERMISRVHQIAESESALESLEQDALNEVGWVISDAFASDVLHTDWRRLAVFPVIDNSMRDAAGNGFSQGDRVVVDFTKTDLRNGGVFVLSDEDLLFIRIIEPISKADDGVFFCRALNTLYPGTRMTLSQTRKVLGRVIAQIRPV